MVEEPLFMPLKERMALLAFASKSLELLEANDLPPQKYADIEQWRALGGQAHDILVALDKKWPGMLALPHDGVRWPERARPE